METKVYRSILVKLSCPVGSSNDMCTRMRIIKEIDFADRHDIEI